MTTALTSHPTDATTGSAAAAGLSRRGFLTSSVASAAAGALAGAGLNLATPASARAQTTLSPDAALHAMMEGNKRFVEGRMTSFNDDLKMLKAKTVGKQEPFAALLSCADSRVPVELAFDQTIGHLFVTRVAGNVASSEIIASLEYGVAVLGTKAIMVLGHANCGAVKASIDAKAVPGQISALYRYIRPAVDQAGKDLDAAIKANAKIQAALLRDSSPVIADAIKQKQLTVVAAFYDLASGKVSLLA
ncbi:MAG: carbonic anhydrase [Alphaproteobacteria bacterium]|nr:carbonic anhydrase [Alphaproteobacteria bacterium]